MFIEWDGKLGREVKGMPTTGKFGFVCRGRWMCRFKALFSCLGGGKLDLARFGVLNKVGLCLVEFLTKRMVF